MSDQTCDHGLLLGECIKCIVPHPMAPWHAYDGCYGCRKGEAVNRQNVKRRDGDQDDGT